MTLLQFSRLAARHTQGFETNHVSYQNPENETVHTHSLVGSRTYQEMHLEWRRGARSVHRTARLFKLRVDATNQMQTAP